MKEDKSQLFEKINKIDKPLSSRDFNACNFEHSHSYSNHFLWKLLALVLFFHFWFPLHCFIPPLCWYFIHPCPVFAPEYYLLHTQQPYSLLLQAIHILRYIWEGVKIATITTVTLIREKFPRLVKPLVRSNTTLR